MPSDTDSRGVSNSELLFRTLLGFWVIGLSSALLDLDHTWSYLGFEEPINLTGWPGRPLHHPVVLLLVSVLLGILLVSLGYGRNVALPVWLVEEVDGQTSVPSESGDSWIEPGPDT